MTHVPVVRAAAAERPLEPSLEPAYERVATLGDIADGELLGVTLGGGERVCLVRQGDEVTALADRCSHAEFALSAGDLLADGSVQCGWHGARFDRRTGEVRQGPACEGVATYAVQVRDETIWVGRR
jgi:3-phenylpropionate/trans-cinnamate dioxygenase ferredoxin subunit